MTAGRNPNLVARELVDESVFVSDAARPVALEAMLQSLGFADAFVPVRTDVFDQSVDAFEQLPILGLPPDVVIPGELVPDQLHSTSSRRAPPPASSRSMAVIR